MSPSDIRMMESRDVVGLLTDALPSEQAFSWLSSVISDPAKVEAVGVLARRYERANRPYHRPANSVAIDPDKFRHAMWKRRLTLKSVGPMINRSDAYANVMINKRRMNFFALDELAQALGIHVNELIAEVATPEELERLDY